MDLHIPHFSPASVAWELLFSVFWKSDVIKVWPFAQLLCISRRERENVFETRLFEGT